MVDIAALCNPRFCRSSRSRQATGDKLSASDRRAALAAGGRLPGDEAGPAGTGAAGPAPAAKVVIGQEPGRYAKAAGRSRSPRAKLG